MKLRDSNNEWVEVKEYSYSNDNSTWMHLIAESIKKYKAFKELEGLKLYMLDLGDAVRVAFLYGSEDVAFKLYLSEIQTIGDLKSRVCDCYVDVCLQVFKEEQ